MSVVINGSAGVTTNSGAVYDSLQRDTAKASTSGTSIDFTGIPSWVKRVTVVFNVVSTNGTSNPLIQIGSGSVTTSGYTARASVISGTSVQEATYTTGFGINSANATNTYTGQLILVNLTGNTWVCSSVIGGAATWFATGVIALSGVLDRVRITTVNGTDAFDNGTINIIYE